jgi:hypothetical protein
MAKAMMPRALATVKPPVMEKVMAKVMRADRRPDPPKLEHRPLRLLPVRFV